MAELVWAIICFILALGSLILSILQFNEKGFPFNNAYIWASKEEREALNKKPYFRQSGICLLFCTGVFFFMGLECVLLTYWLWLIVLALCVATLVYAFKTAVKC